IRISNLRFSNRKFLAISHRPFLLSNGPVAKPRRGTLPTHHSLPDATFLIETPRLEFSAIPTKQSSLPISNRDKIALLAPQKPSILGIPRSTLVVSPLLNSGDPMTPRKFLAFAVFVCVALATEIKAQT